MENEPQIDFDFRSSLSKANSEGEQGRLGTWIRFDMGRMDCMKLVTMWC